MDEIVPRLWLGDSSDAARLRADDGFDNWVIIDVRGLVDPDFPLKTNESACVAIANAIHEYCKLGRQVLVHCDAGIERSPMAVMVFLVLFREKKPGEAYELIMSKRPCVQRRNDVWLPQKWR